MTDLSKPLVADDGECMPCYRLPQADSRVNYRLAGEGDEQRCMSCRFYAFGSCNLVEGTIEAPNVCDLWTAYPMVWMAAPDGRRRLFTAHRFAEPPEWLPLLPVPGTYKHPVYGEMELSRERLAQFAASVNAGTYLPKLPINAEHEDDTGGALGWIVEARQNADGSVDARVEWTDRGVDAIKADRFLYVSPEWFDAWSDLKGVRHSNVVVGAALCTKPFFKPPYLRPLAANDAHTAPPQPATAGATPPEVSMSDTTKAGAGAAPETDVKALSDRLTAIEAELTATKAAKESSDAALKQATEQIATMQTSERRKRFTDEVMGKSDANGHMWAGEVAKNVSVLETLADAVGEDSEQFRDFVAQQRATAAQLAKSGLFSEAGSSQGGAVGGSAWARIEAEAKRVAGDEKVSIEVAMDRVIQRNPALYAEYSAERKKGV